MSIAKSATKNHLYFRTTDNGHLTSKLNPDSSDYLIDYDFSSLADIGHLTSDNEYSDSTIQQYLQHLRASATPRLGKKSKSVASRTQRGVKGDLES